MLLRLPDSGHSKGMAGVAAVPGVVVMADQQGDLVAELVAEVVEADRFYSTAIYRSVRWLYLLP
jgi:hypothetical protein